MNPPSLADLGFRFTTQRERDIYDRLQLIGDGPAANFFDACRIIAENENVRLQSATHLVGHLLREIESAVRDVLLAFACHDDPDVARVNGKEIQKREIRVILGYYHIEETSGVGQLWLALAGANTHAPSYIKPLHAFAHRNALARPRPLNGAFRLFWDDILGLLHTLVTLFEDSYATAIDIVDELLTHAQPTTEDARHLQDELPNNRVVLSYFFDGCQNPSWINMLAARGFFAHPPAMELDEETGATLGYPVWSASRYLARMARLPSAQRAVESIIRDLMSAHAVENVHVRQDIVEILSQLPVDRIADLALQAAEWLEDEAE